MAGLVVGGAMRICPLTTSIAQPAAEILKADPETGAIKARFQLPSPAGGLDYDRLLRLIEERISLVPRYRQRMRSVPGGLANPVWVDDPGFDVTRHVRRARETNFRELTDRVMSEPLDRDRPLWELWVADRLDDSVANLRNRYEFLCRLCV